MNSDIKTLKAILKQLGWSDELIASVENAAAIPDAPVFGQAPGEYMNQWRVIDSNGRDLALPPALSTGGFDLKPAATKIHR
jgi:hypothetical protein